MKTILKNCKLITPPYSEEKLYDIFIEGGLIADIGENLHVEDARELDLDGHVVLPGFIAVSYTHLTLPTTSRV